MAALGAPLHLRFAYHVNINCRHLEASLEFYQSLGFREVLDFGVMEGSDLERGLNVAGARARGVLLRLGDSPRSCHIDLLEWLEPLPEERPLAVNGLGVARLCFYTSDIHADYRTLVQRGVTVVSEPVPVRSSGLVEDVLAFCFLDPDGTILEMVQVGRSEG